MTDSTASPDSDSRFDITAMSVRALTLAALAVSLGLWGLLIAALSL